MEIISAQSLSFTYPDAKGKALSNNRFTIDGGEFVVLCGPSGSGKSTLLKLMKHDIAPYGTIEGELLYKGTKVEKHPPLIRAKQIGMVFQNPDNQIVMDTVMEELLFGLENVGYSTVDMRKKIAEMVHFFDLNHLLEKKTHELSGGEKQLINLASVLLLDPDILLLDEPTAQLDPIAAKEFIHTLERLNDEFGITVIIAEHRLEELFSIADKVIVLEGGQMTHVDRAQTVVGELVHKNNFKPYLPSASRLYATYCKTPKLEHIPLTVKETKKWLNEQHIEEASDWNENTMQSNKEILRLQEVDFQYEAYRPPVLHNLSMSVAKGELHAILGANGTGKSTLLKLISGILKAQHGYIKFDGTKQKKLESGVVGYLPQNPELFFVQETIIDEYRFIAKHHQLKNAEIRIEKLLEQFELHSLKNRHPYDLSGGQLQKAALVGSLLINPIILLIDEPTKGLDPDFKQQLGATLQRLVQDGLTILMVSHDVEFAASYATRCSMLFQGQITVTEDTGRFFRENMYYTTVMNRIIRKMNVPPVITLQEAKQKWRFPENF